MYCIAVIRYRKGLEEVERVTGEHRAYLRGLAERGVLIASGPFEPRMGGALLLRVPDEGYARALDAIRDGDPFIQQGIAQYEMAAWNPTIGREKLDGI